MQKGNVDPGFEKYRRERERRRRLGDGKALNKQPGSALHELEAVEAREEQDRRLTRDVQEFFESATRTAASIVRRVADSAKEEVDSKLNNEMAEFLQDALSRLQTLVLAVVGDNHGPQAQEEVEPRMRNLVGQMLDEFRSAGTAGTNKHLGEDPTAKDVDEIRREFEAKKPGARAADASSVPVTGVGDEARGDQRRGGGDLDGHKVADLGEPQPAAPAGGPDQKAGQDKGGDDQAELDKFKESLKAKVRQGKMTRDEARAAWQERIARKP